MQLKKITEEIDKRAQGRPIGGLQELRKVLKHMKRLPHHHIFHAQTVFEDYAYNYGGRKELQFNIGFEAGGTELRHGVAFSFQTSRTLPDLNPLIPRVERFNEFLRLQPDAFKDLLMRQWEANVGISPKYPVTPIPASLVRPGVFIFLGRFQPTKAIDYDLLLDDWDRLMFIYQYTEGDQTFPPVAGSLSHLSAPEAGFRFKSGCVLKRSSTKASTAERTLNVNLRHNDLQIALHNYLCGLYGQAHVGTENVCLGGKIDVVHRRGDHHHTFYEIKTGISAQGCIREGLAQILEYSYWPGSQEAAELVIVGEAPLENDTKQYIKKLRDEFGLPLAYRRFDMAIGKLV